MAFSTTVAQRGLNSPFEGIIQAASAQNGVPVALIKAIISQESVWNPNAVNAADPSYGLMQVNTKAHPDVAPDQMLDPSQNIPYGTAYLAYQLNRYGGDMAKAVSAYNAGTAISTNVAGYVQPVMQYYQWFLANDPGSGGGGGIEVPPVDNNGVDITDSDMKVIAGLAVGMLLLFMLLRR